MEVIGSEKILVPGGPEERDTYTHQKQDERANMWSQKKTTYEPDMCSQQSLKPHEIKIDCGVEQSNNKSATLIYGDVDDAEGEPTFSFVHAGGDSYTAQFRWGQYADNSQPIPGYIVKALEKPVVKPVGACCTVTLKVRSKTTSLPDLKEYF